VGNAEKSATGCRFCGGSLADVVDLGMSPRCERLLAADQLDRVETFYPLKVKVCERCFLMQLPHRPGDDDGTLAGAADLNDFVAGIRLQLAPDGVATVEFPHLLRLIAENQYDAIYRERIFYFALATAERVFAAHGLRVFDVAEIRAGGGSLRVSLCRETSDRPTNARVAEIKASEAAAGLDRLAGFAGFAEQVRQARWNLMDFLIRAKWYGKSVVAYGAPGNGNALLNHAGIRPDIVDYAVDRDPCKHGCFTPGTRIPVAPPARVRETRPDYLLILPWTLKHEIMATHGYIRDWGGQFVVPIPDLTLFP